MDGNYSAPNNNEKIEYFSKSVKLNTDILIKQIEEEMKNYREDFLREETRNFENEINDYYNKNISEIDSELKIKLSKIKIEKKHEYLKIRDELQKNFFDDLEKKIIEFVNTSEYEKFLLRSCERCLDTFNENSRLLIYIGDKDKEKVPLIERFFENKFAFDIEVSDDIKFGGLCYHNITDGIILNETIDGRLAEEKEYFNQ